MVKQKLTWLLLLVRLPATHKAERVAIWRKLKKSGAIQIQTSTYVLPDEPARYETFQWLSQHIRDAGGHATLVRAREIEGLYNEKVVSLFNAARAKEYAALRELVRVSAVHRKRRSSLAGTLERFRKQLREIHETDFFNCPQAQDVEMMLRRLEGVESRDTILQKLRPRDYRNKIWVTRPRPEIDRVGSAWLIQKFIDSKARFAFAKKIPPNRSVISFDMLDAEFSHHGPDCTFETLAKRFGIADRAITKIGEMIHDADLDDARFQRTECIGIDRVLKGWARGGMSDKEILRRGFECFDGLYVSLRRE